MIDRKPRAIVSRRRRRSCVNSACDIGIPLAIRGGGHSAPGYRTCDDGMVAERVRVDGGCTGPMSITRDMKTVCGIVCSYEGEERITTSYTENYGRLAAVKAKYDPENIFRLNQNIKPA